MRYKLALVMALVLKPDLLLLDEPFGPLDHSSASVLSKELTSVAANGASVLLSSHQPTPGLRPDLLLVLDGGHLGEDGDTASDDCQQVSADVHDPRGSS